MSDLSHDESWLSQVHTICNDAGIPAGHVVSRVKQLRAQLAELTELIEYCKAMKEDAERLDWLKAHARPTVVRVGCVSFRIRLTREAIDAAMGGGNG